MKLFAKILAVMLALTALFSFASCKEIENGSKIERIKITIALEDTEGETTNYEVEAKLYVNFAPETIAHVKALIESGYYNGLDITNVASTYFQFGDYKFENGVLNAVDGEVATVKGEFEKKGFIGNKLKVTQGAIILKRDTEGTETLSKYDTGKATLAVALSSGAPFNVKEYCIFGMVVSDDGNKEADSSSMEYLSSLDKILKVKETLEDANGRKLYYCISDDTKVEEDDENAFNWEGQYFTYAEYDDEFNYFKGVLTAEDLLDSDKVAQATLTEEEVADLKSKIGSSANFMSIPTLTAKIVSIEFVK